MKAKNNKNKNNTKISNILKQYVANFDYDFDLIYLKEIVKNTKTKKYNAVRG